MRAAAFLAASLALAAVATSTEVRSQPGQVVGAAPSAEPMKRVSVEQLAKVLQDSGYRAEIVQGSKSRYIRSGLSGKRIAIYMYDCKEDACGAYQFSAIFTKSPKYTLAFVNAWNKTRRYAKVYLDNDEDLNFEWDIDIDGGVTPAFVKTTISSFETYLGSFDKFTP